MDTVLILAGGLGKRLSRIARGRPKAMMEVGGHPFLEWLLIELRRQGFDDLVLCTGYRGEQIEEYFADGSRWNVRIRYSREMQALGTGGALKLASRLARGENAVALNGDSFLYADLAALRKLHVSSNAAVTLALACVSDTSRFGRVETDGNGRVTEFAEKEAGGQSRGRPGHINAGVYVLSRAALDAIPETGKVSLEYDVLPLLLTSPRGIYALSFDGFFVDMGLPNDYMALAENPGRIMWGS